MKTSLIGSGSIARLVRTAGNI
jgi:predicted DNA-binding WGR domain protein